MNGPAGFDPIAGILRTELRPGAGIDMTGGTISVITPPEGVPYVAGDGVFINGATIGANLTGGYRMEVVSGSTIAQQRYFPITNVTGASVTLEAGGYYKINATTSAVTLNTETVPAGSAGLEGHAQIFVAGTGYVVTGANVTLANALEPDSVNNCTLRFHDGKCIISVEDHVAGYIVVSATGTSAGSLYYGLGTASEAYIAVDASLNGQVLDLGGVTTSAGEKHVVGNGYTETIFSGAINCTSKTTFANLAANNVVVSSGTLTLGDVFIPSGSTVAVSGGGLEVEKVVGEGETSVIDLGGSYVFVSNDIPANVSGCTISGGGGTNGGAFYANRGTLNITSCVLSGNTANKGGGVFNQNGLLNASGCVISGNVATPNRGVDIYNTVSGTVVLNNCTIGQANCDASASFVLGGTNSIGEITGIDSTGYVTISSGAIIDLTGNTNTTPIAPGGGITFAQGGAAVYPSAGQASAYMLGGMTVPKITNTTTVDLGGSNIVIGSGTTASASGCTFSGGSATYGGGLNVKSATAILKNCTFTGNLFSYGGKDIYIASAGLVELTSCILDDASDENIYMPLGEIQISGCTISGILVVDGWIQIVGNNAIGKINHFGDAATCSVTISSGASINLTSSINPGGGIVVEAGGCAVNGVSVAGGVYTSIVSSGGSAVVNE